MVMKAPIVPVLRHSFHNLSRKRKVVIYQALVLFLTYLTYLTYHAAKRPFSVVKGVLAPDCNVTAVNNTCHPWKPFDNHAKSKDLFGFLDCAFLLTYALSMFISGYIAERTNIRIYLSLGMILTGLFTSLIAIAFYFRIHSLAFFFAFQVITGITQSSGWPCVVESVGMWFPEGRRGAIMGVWNTHLFVGNMVGSAIAGHFAAYNWGLSFIVPGCMIGGLGIIIFIFLIPDPHLVGLAVEKRNEVKNLNTVGYDGLSSGSCVSVSSEELELEHTDAVGIWRALKIPGVVEYALCLFFAKLVSYTFLFWLPYYIGVTAVGGKHLDVTQSADLAIVFDIGGGLGGIIAGVLVDFTRSPGIVNVVMLLLAAPFLFMFKFYGSKSYATFITYMFISGFFVNGPYALITTAVSASLGSHQCLLGNTKAMAVVTSIIDATGSLGAAVGPLLAGIISSKTQSWDGVFYMLIGCDILASFLLSRQVINEIKALCRQLKNRYCLLNSFNGESETLLSEDS